MEVDDLIKNISIETLQGTSIYERVREDIESIRKYQEAVCVLVNNPDEAKLNILRNGTILSFSVIGKILQGKYPREFSKEDWKDIADNVADYGINMDGQRYTEFVFNLFALYIDYSVDLHKETISDSSAAEIKGLAAEIRTNTDKLENGTVTEPNYVDDCLWISFEAMIKLLAAYKTRGLCKEYAGFIKAVADISVQYGRYRLYQNELNLLNGYLDCQNHLDEKLEVKYNKFIENLHVESEMFDRLIENAFSEDFDEMFRSSVVLAQRSGVSQEEILDSKDKIDAFFL